ncbi:DNA methyltransferase [Gallibacterium genomosp. 3]|uniref:Methyltransferase n=1 Tax=Gallibacterium genomosp. 3 TaxID=505345 RepID=A0A1A7QD09_9PAST|nr:DNA methyltransferase [Gallibacterium genomosp. 3]OBX12026.1 restriction endonuclease subunit M [Gallibacterium genomosp. 3]
MYSKINLTKENIKQQKKNSQEFSSLITAHYKNSNDLVFILENLGALPKSFDANTILHLLDHKNENVRFWTVKTIGKLHSSIYLENLFKVVSEDESTLVKREAVSSIGRKRTREAIPFLVQVLSNHDPKIVCQAIRGLLVFKGDNNIDETLRGLINHENEMVRTIIYKEYYASKQNNNSHLPHAQTFSYLKNVVVHGDVRDTLKYVPDDSIHLTFTSPPYYNARDYSIYPSYKAYLEFLEEVFLETFRITKEGRFLIVNTSPVIIPRISRAHSSKRYPIPFDLHYFLTNMGWEFIDDIVWEKPEYSVKNRIGGFQQHRKPLAYKPNSVTEYLMVYRKNTDKLIDWNIRQYDTQTVNDSKVKDGFETTNIWRISPKSDKIHSAIFPVELCQRVVEYYSFKGDLVFDPFAGSGTLGRTAKKLGRRFFLTEKEEKYFEYMKSLQKNKATLFDEEKTKFLTLTQFKETII